MIVFQESKIQNNLLIWSPTVLRQRSHLGCEFHFSPQKMQTSVTPCHVQEQDHVIVKWCSVTSMDTHCHEHFALLGWTLIMYLTEYFQLIRRGVEGTLIKDFETGDGTFCLTFIFFRFYIIYARKNKDRKLPRIWSYCRLLGLSGRKTVCDFHCAVESFPSCPCGKALAWFKWDVCIFLLCWLHEQYEVMIQIYIKESPTKGQWEERSNYFLSLQVGDIFIPYLTWFLNCLFFFSFC